jgi:hypothetical protein
MTVLRAEDPILCNDKGSTSVCAHAHTCNPPKGAPWSQSNARCLVKQGSGTG